MKFFYFFLFIGFDLSSVFAQNKILLLKSDEKAAFYVVESERKLNVSEQKFLIPDTIKKFRVSNFYPNYNQYIYQRYSQNNNDSIAGKEIKRRKINIASKYSKENLKCYGNILLYNKESDGKLMFVFDSNNDYDFTKESQYDFTSYFENDSLNNAFVKISPIEVYDTGSQRKANEEFYIQPIVKNGYDVDSLQLFFKLKNKTRIGTFNVDNKTYQLNVYNNNTTQIFDSTDVFFYVTKKGEQKPKFLKLFDYYRLNETIRLGGTKTKGIKIKSIDPFGYETEFLVEKDLRKIYGNRTGDYLKETTVFDINGNTYILQNSFSGNKFTVLEFWGTWCGPCISIMNDYEKLVNNFSALGVSFFSVAYDKSKETVTEFLKAHQRSGINIFDEQGNKTGISAQMGVESFPSFFVFDRAGKIIFRDDGTNGFQNLSKFFKSQL